MWIEFTFIVVLAALLALTPLVFHEMGHWAVLRRYGVSVQEHWLGLGPMLFRWKKLRIGMLPIGGAVVPEPVAYAKLSPRQKLWVALAGPFASLVYAMVSLGVWWFGQDLPGSDALWLVSMLNFVLAGLNLLPVPPLDGFQAWVQWRQLTDRPLSELTLARAQRLGNGLVYGIGFCVLGFALLY